MTVIWTNRYIHHDLKSKNAIKFKNANWYSFPELHVLNICSQKKKNNYKSNLFEWEQMKGNYAKTYFGEICA